MNMNEFTARPLIGITADSEEGGYYSEFPWYALRKNYCTAVVIAGGIPVVLPHESALADSYARMIDGLIISGGAFDIDPALFGAEARHNLVALKERRTKFELALITAVLDLDKPTLGICG